MMMLLMVVILLIVMMMMMILMMIMLQKPFPRDVSLLIRDSFLCGSSGTSVSVCCPRDGLVTPASPETESPEPVSRRSEPECLMQAGAGAECVTYSQCSPFVQLLINIKKPLDPVVPAMIRYFIMSAIANHHNLSLSIDILTHIRIFFDQNAY